MNVMKKNRVLIIGLGRLGSSIATLLSVEGEEVLVIDKSEDSFRKLSDRFSGYEITGDVVDADVLENAGIKSAKTVVATTNDDNMNIFIAQICFYIYDVPNIYIRLSDNNKKKLIENTNVKAIYPFELSMDEFKRLREKERI